jgi:hypothetical protein
MITVGRVFVATGSIPAAVRRAMNASGRAANGRAVGGCTRNKKGREAVSLPDTSYSPEVRFGTTPP